MKGQNETKNSYIYRVFTTRVCKWFFLFIYSLKLKQFKRLQNCNSNNSGFQLNYKNNNFVIPCIIEVLKIFLKNKIEELQMPNPSNKGPEYYLPSNINWNKIYTDFCEIYKTVHPFNQKTPISYST